MNLDDLQSRQTQQKQHQRRIYIGSIIGHIILVLLPLAALCLDSCFGRDPEIIETINIEELPSVGPEVAPETTRLPPTEEEPEPEPQPTPEPQPELPTPVAEPEVALPEVPTTLSEPDLDLPKPPKKVSVKENLAELLIRQSMRSSNADAFEKTVFPALNPPKKNAAGSTGTISMQDWFLQICMDDVLGRGIPAACPWIEMQFTEIMAQIHPILKAPKKNPDNTPGKFSEEEIAAMTRAEQKLNQLGLKSTEQIALKLFRCARSIRNFKLSPHNLESLPALKQDEQAVYTALSERVALEARLRSAEKKLLPPGSRWALTMKAIARKNADLPLLSRANSLLDHFEKEF